MMELFKLFQLEKWKRKQTYENHNVKLLMGDLGLRSRVLNLGVFGGRGSREQSGEVHS